MFLRCRASLITALGAGWERSVLAKEAEHKAPRLLRALWGKACTMRALSCSQCTFLQITVVIVRDGDPARIIYMG